MNRFIFLLLGIFSSLFSPSVAQKYTYLGTNKLYYGASYYPESWPASNLAEDIKQMKAANINVVRMAEFSWSKMEPEEGVYTFEWLHKIIEDLHKNGIDVILGTPSATPPAWLWEKYPEIANVRDNGFVEIHGARRNTNYTNELWRKKATGIAEKMAVEFGNKPGVIGWQIDNELGLHTDYSEHTRKRWIEYLRTKYGSIENLNQLWATDLWSQTYQRFEQIPMPVSQIWHHNSLRFEWSRFTSLMATEFMNLQVAAIKKHSALPITHDTMPGQSLDYEKLMAKADYMSVNNYHSFEAYDRIISNYDRMRGYKKGMHWLFETAPNYSGGGSEGQTWFLHQPDGSLHAALWINFALGGQGAMYWLWRQQRAGQEMVHGSIINAWGKPAANFDDIKKLGEDLGKTSDFLMSTPVAKAKMAIVYSHEADMGLRIEQYVNGLRYYTDWTYRFYLPFHDAGLHRDVIAPGQNYDDYKVIFAPLWPYISDDQRSRLKNWVALGGTLILGPMSGYRTNEWAFFTDYALGDLEEWSGIEVDSRIPIGLSRRSEEIPLFLQWNIDSMEKAEASLWSDALSGKGKILASYENGMHNGKAAIMENNYKKGKLVVLGTDPGRAAITKLLLHYAEQHEIKPTYTGDKNVLVVPRENQKQRGTIVVNHSNEVKNISIEKVGVDLLNGEKTSQKLNLNPYEVKVIRH